MLGVSDSWKTACPGATAGALVIAGVSNPARHPDLDRRVATWEAALRAQPVLQACGLLSPLSQDLSRRAPAGVPLLQGPGDAAEPRARGRHGGGRALRSGLLTAGHDLAVVERPVTLDVPAGGERYVLLNGREEALKAGDMMMADRRGIISSVLYGPDQRTRITPATRQVFLAVYAPPGIGEGPVRSHLEALRDAVLSIAPDGSVEALEIHRAA